MKKHTHFLFLTIQLNFDFELFLMWPYHLWANENLWQVKESLAKAEHIWPHISNSSGCTCYLSLVTIY